MFDDDMQSGKVYLAGAGPGDPGLLTLRAAEAIRASDVILYDNLVNPEVLVHARRGVELIYVGKRAGQESISQEEINHLLISHALAGRTVTRLKGGDPFIFGRGAEEALALAHAGIDWEVIPGISSGVAAASYAGIPLTDRDRASSVAFITGHDSRKKRHGVDWSRTAWAADTLVIFMCAETITAIARELILAGRSPETPVAVIRWGTYEHQEVLTGSLEEVAETDFEITPPAIAVIGDVVSLREKLRWFDHQSFPLRSVEAQAV